MTNIWDTKMICFKWPDPQPLVQKIKMKIQLSSISGQSYKASMLVKYDSRVVPDWKIPHIMTIES